MSEQQRRHRDALRVEVLKTLDAYTARHCSVTVECILNALMVAYASIVESNFDTRKERGAVWSSLIRSLPDLAAEVERRVAEATETLQ